MKSLFTHKAEKEDSEPLLSNLDYVSVVLYLCTELFCFMLVFCKVKCLCCKNVCCVELKFTYLDIYQYQKV